MSFLKQHKSSCALNSASYSTSFLLLGSLGLKYSKTIFSRNAFLKNFKVVSQDARREVQQKLERQREENRIVTSSYFSRILTYYLCKTELFSSSRNESVLNKFFLNQFFLNKFFLNKFFLNQFFLNQFFLNKFFLNQFFLNQFFLNKFFLNKFFLNQSVLNQSVLNELSKVQETQKKKQCYSFYSALKSLQSFSFAQKKLQILTQILFQSKTLFFLQFNDQKPLNRFIISCDHCIFKRLQVFLPLNYSHFCLYLLFLLFCFPNFYNKKVTVYCEQQQTDEFYLENVLNVSFPVEINSLKNPWDYATPQILLAAAPRCMQNACWFKPARAYSIGFYVDKDKFDSFKKNKEKLNFKHLFDANVDKTLRFVFVSSKDSWHIIKGFERALVSSLPSKESCEFDFEKGSREISEFKQVLKGLKFNAGSVLSITMISNPSPGKSIIFYAKDSDSPPQFLAEIKGSGLIFAFHNMFLENVENPCLTTKYKTITESFAKQVQDKINIP